VFGKEREGEKEEGRRRERRWEEGMGKSYATGRNLCSK
jgi:hypothetical protein